MKILFVIRSLQIFHYYESIVVALKARGHEVSLLFDKKWSSEEFSNDIKYPYQWTVEQNGNFRRRILLFLREVRSWRRYLLIKGQSSFYADRWLKYVSPKFRFLIKIFPFSKFFIKTKLFGNFLKSFELSSLPDEQIIDDIKKRAPDIVIAGPVCFRQSSADLEYLKVAQKLKIPTVVPVMTWDTLTTKGLFHIKPDLLLVWNEAQVKEAEEHQGIKKENIKIIGAPFFDKWFKDYKPSVSREEFAKKHGFNSKYPIIAYLGSSENIAPDERWLIKEIKSALDNSEMEKIKNTQMIFRPHPANYKAYKDFSLSGVFFQREGNLPKDSDAMQDFYDLFYHCVAVISINTSGMVDAILAGKPVISLERKEFSKTQILAQHYKHMRDSNALYITKTPEEFLLILKKLISGNDSKKKEREKFIQTFIRPLGVDKSAGDAVVYEVEQLKNKR